MDYTTALPQSVGWYLWAQADGRTAWRGALVQIVVVAPGYGWVCHDGKRRGLHERTYEGDRPALQEGWPPVWWAAITLPKGE